MVDAPNAPYPLKRTGGLFIMSVGFGVIAAVIIGILFPTPYIMNFYAIVFGFILGTFALFTSRLSSIGRPTKVQAYALYGAISLELLLFTFAPNFLPYTPTNNPEKWWLWAFIFVGIHFLPMTWSFGRAVFILGMLCILNAMIGLLVPNISFLMICLIDGSLKVTFGIWMFGKNSSA